jgi:hypothetical protein
MEGPANKTGNLTNSTDRIQGNDSFLGGMFPPFPFVLSTMDSTWITVFSVLTAVGVLGNTLVILLILGNKSLRRNTNYFIVNMAISDGIFLIFLMLSTLQRAGIFPLYSKPMNPILGNIICRLLFFLNASQLVSLLTLLILSMSRFRAVATPLLATPISRNARVLLITAIWVLSAMLYVSQLAVKAYKWQGPFVMSCPVVLSLGTLSFFYWIQMIFPMVIFIAVLIINLKILRKLRKTRIAVSLPTAQEQIRKKRITNAVRMVLCSLGLYVVMWFPIHIESFLFNVVPPSIYAQSLDSSSFNVLYLCWGLNSTLSPLVYFAFLGEFRNALRKCLHIRTNEN